MIGRLRILGIALGVIGLGFVVVGGYAFFKVQEGTSSLKAFSAAQAVELSYNEDGQLVDGGEVAGAAVDHGPPHGGLGLSGRPGRARSE